MNTCVLLKGILGIWIVLLVYFCCCLFNFFHLSNLSRGQGREVSCLVSGRHTLVLLIHENLKGLLMASGNNSGSWLCRSDVSHPVPQGLGRGRLHNLVQQPVPERSRSFFLGAGSCCFSLAQTHFLLHSLPLKWRRATIILHCGWTVSCDSSFIFHLEMLYPLWLDQRHRETGKMFWAVLVKNKKEQQKLIGPRLPEEADQYCWTIRWNYKGHNFHTN